MGAADYTFTATQKQTIARNAQDWLRAMGVQTPGGAAEYILDTENASLEDDNLLIWVLSADDLEQRLLLKVPLGEQGAPDLSGLESAAAKLVGMAGGAAITAVADSLAEQVREYVGWFIAGYQHIADHFWEKLHQGLAALETKIINAQKSVVEVENRIKAHKFYEPEYIYDPDDGPIYGLAMGLKKITLEIPPGLWNAAFEMADKLNDMQSRVYTSMEMHDMIAARKALGIAGKALIHVLWEVIWIVGDDVLKAAPLLLAKGIAGAVKVTCVSNMLNKLPKKAENAIDIGAWLYGKWQVYDQYMGEVEKAKGETESISQRFSDYREIAENVRRGAKGE